MLQARRKAAHTETDTSRRARPRRRTPDLRGGESIEDYLLALRQRALMLQGVLFNTGLAGEDFVTGDGWMELSDVAGEMVERIRELEAHLPVVILSRPATKKPAGA